MNFLTFSLARFCATHREFLWGVLAGSVLEALIIFSAHWTWHRILWVKWFSWQ